MNRDKNVHTFIGCDSDYGDSRIVVFGTPFDSTTSFRPGARFGPPAMRGESWGLETYSPYQDLDLSDLSVFDGGDLELTFGGPERALSQIEAYVSDVLSDAKIPCMIGGEHLVTLGAMRAAVNKYPDLHILHFDAHADLREAYLEERLSHACVMRRCHDLTGDGKIFQFGIRSGDKSEFDWAAQGHVQMQKFNFDGLSKTVKHLKGKPVYFTLDLDVLDPSCFGGTGTPEPGGVSFRQLLEAVLLLKNLNIVGFDIDELSPAYDPSGASTAAACKIMRELLILIGNGKQA